ncbi:MAG: ATP-binding protein [Bacteroidetes bacterium]|nr:MAG: ATP-binding protein [Bacteroidota bacterium]
MKRISFRNSYEIIRERINSKGYVYCYGSKFIGKSSFFKSYFPELNYVSLKYNKWKQLLELDPERFFRKFRVDTLFDEIQEFPGFEQLFMQYGTETPQNIMIVSDLPPETEHPGIVRMLPLSARELKNEHLFSFLLEESIWEGGFPRGANSSYLYYLKQSLQTPSVRVHEKDRIRSFFIKSLQQIDQCLNLKKLADSCEISQPTAARWLDLLVQLGLLILLPAWDRDFGKRQSKSPKLYCCDTGLAAHFLGIRKLEKLAGHPAFSALCNNYYLLEIMKQNLLLEPTKELFYWKESNGHEIPLLIRNPTSVDIFVFTSRETPFREQHAELDYFDQLSDGLVLSRNVICGAFKNKIYRDVKWISWHRIT